MTRGVVAAIAALVIALACVALGTSWLIRRSHEALIEQLAADQTQTVQETARILGDDIDQIAADLRFLQHLLETDQPAARTTEVAALLTWTKQYHRVGVYDLHGRPLLEVRDPTLPPEREPERFKEGMRAMVPAVLGGKVGVLELARSLKIEGGSFRVFGMPLGKEGQPPTGVVEMLVDTEPLFEKLRLVTAHGGSRLLLLGARGGPMAVSDAGLTRAVRELSTQHTPGLARLVESMRASGQGLVELDGDEAAAIGLGHDRALAAYAPVVMNERLHWSIAIFSPTTRIAEHERAIVRRLAASAAAVAVLLCLFGGYVVVSTRRAAALRERLRATDALARLHARTEKILNQIPTGVLTLSSDRRIVAVNHALSQRLPPEIVGRALADAFGGAPAAVVRMIGALLDGAEHAAHVVSVHGERLALFGDEGQYNLHAVPLESADDDARVLLVIEDLTDVRQLESQLLRAEKLATVGELAAGVAHEMGTPLGVVRGRAEYILGKLGGGHPQADGMNDIIEQIDHVTRTIRQLLDFSRVSPAQVQPVELGPIAGDVVTLLRFERDRRRTAVKIEAPDGLPPISADPDQLRQVLVNLIKNGLDACAGGGDVTVRARVEPAGAAPWDRVRIEVEDTGCGIPASEIHRVFDPFFTTKKRGQGTGLGLAVSAQVVRNHGGEIAIESVVGQGTRVSMLWPIAAVEERHASG